MTNKKGHTTNCATHLEQGPRNTKPAHVATKLELVAQHLVESGPEGISSLSALAGFNDLNSRNSISELRRRYEITILDEYFSHQHSGGGVVYFKRYWVADCTQAQKLVELLNLTRQQRGTPPLSLEQIARYLSAFPAATQSTELPPAT